MRSSICSMGSGACSGGLLLGSEDVVDARGKLRADAHPVVHAIEFDRGVGIGLGRVVGPDLLDETTVTTARVVRGDDVVVGTVLGAAAGQTEDNHASLSKCGP